MKIKKAVITAAGPGQRSLPLQSLVDRDGQDKPALAIVLEEAQSAGVEEACVVVHPGDEDAYAKATEASPLRLQFTTQSRPRGYGHALFCAREFVGSDPFLHLISDHLYTFPGATTCAQALVAVAGEESAAVSAVQSTRESKLPYYGAVAGPRVSHNRGLYTIQKILEKPTPTLAERELLVPGLRAGHYLCFFGMHVLTPRIMDLLAAQVEAADGGSVDLTTALGELAKRERYLAFESEGRRYNIGMKYGLLHAQLALALGGVDRDEVLTNLVELLATAPAPAVRNQDDGQP